MWGITDFALPFVDAGWLLASNPCDVLGRVPNDVPLWSAPSWVPLGRADRVAVGLSLDAGPLASLALLPAPSGGRAWNGLPPYWPPYWGCRPDS